MGRPRWVASPARPPPLPPPPPPTLFLSADLANHLPPLRMNVSYGRLVANGKPFDLKGIEWHGTEQEAMVPQGLGNHSLDYYLTFLQQHSFNGIRLPFDHDRMLRNAIVVDSHHVRLAPELLHLRYVNVFTTIAKAAARRGQLIVLACDRLTFSAAPGQPGSGLWYSGEVSEEQVQRSWAHIADVLCSQWNVIGVDLQSQPFRASWDSPGKGPPTFNPATDWNAAATRLGNFVLSKCPRWLVFVEGVGETPGARDQQLEGGAHACTAARARASSRCLHAPSGSSLLPSRALSLSHTLLSTPCATQALSGARTCGAHAKTRSS